MCNIPKLEFQFPKAMKIKTITFPARKIYTPAILVAAQDSRSKTSTFIQTWFEPSVETLAALITAQLEDDLSVSFGILRKGELYGMLQSEIISAALTSFAAAVEYGCTMAFHNYLSR